MKKFNYWQKFEKSGYYHIYNRGINGTTIFSNEENYYYFLRKWAMYIDPLFDTLAYCLMSNHIHFLVRVKPVSRSIRNKILQMRTSKSRKFIESKISYNEFLEDQFKRLFSSYVLAYNKRIDRHGSLFEKRFKRVKVNTPNAILYKLAYIHHNPIHHGYTKDYENWPYSSYHALLFNKETCLNKKKLLKLFDTDNSSAMESFLRHHEEFKNFKEWTENEPELSLLNLKFSKPKV